MGFGEFLVASAAKSALVNLYPPARATVQVEARVPRAVRGPQDAFETMPSQPSAQARRQTIALSAMKCALNAIPACLPRSSDFRVLLQVSISSRRKSSPSSFEQVESAKECRRAGPVSGPRLHDWCYLELADLEGEDSNHHSQVLWTRGLLIRRNIANGDLAYFTTWCPAGTSIKTLVSVEGHRWAIEDSFETAKNEFGLDHNESRSWHGWHRHVSLVMLAFAMMAAIQHQANKPAPKKTKSSATPRHPTSSVGRSRKSAA